MSLDKLIKKENKYWVITFSVDDAHIVEADEEEIYTNPVKTWRVYYRDLKYKYINVDEEAKKTINERKNMIDPRILFNSKYTINDVLALPQMKHRVKDKDYLKSSLHLLREAPYYVKGKKIREYDEAKKLPYEKLYRRIRQELEQKKHYVPQQIRKFTQGELMFGLPQAGYLVGKIGFPTFEQAIDSLYTVWEKTRKTPEIFTGLEKITGAEAQKNMKKFWEKFFQRSSSFLNQDS